MNAPLSTALELAEQQLVALELGDTDAFLQGVAAHEAACAALVSLLETTSLDHEELLVLEQLVATNRLVSTNLANAMDDVSRRLAAMTRGRSATSAYLSSAPGSISGLREA